MKNLFAAFFLLSLFACNTPTEKSQKTINPTTTDSISKVEKPQAKKGKEKTILYFGDSLTAAYNLETSDGYPAQIQKKIDELGLNYKTVNAGISGETSSGGKERIDWVLEQKIDIFVLALGANDMLRGTDLDLTKKNLQNIIDEVKAKYPAVQIVIAGMLAPPNLGKTYTNKFKNLFATLAKKNAAVLVPFLLEGVAGDKTLNLPDGMHPTAEGYKIVANNVWEVLKPIL